MRLERTSAEEIGLLVARFTGEAAPISPEIRLDQIGFDSLTFVEFAAAAQEELGVDLPDAALPVTVGDLVGLVDLVDPSVPSRRGRRDPAIDIPPGMGRYQSLVRDVAEPVVRWLFRLEVDGREHLPARGPVIVCLNHDSAIDVVVTAVAAHRPLVVMGKKEIFISRLVSHLFHEMGAFPVERDRWDRRAVAISLAALDKGHALAMWPEGTRAAHELLPFLPGAAWLALARGVPLVPAAIIGSGHAWPRDRMFPKRSPVRVAFGEAISVERVDAPGARLAIAPEITAVLRDRVEQLLGESGPTAPVPR
ncbi:MAG: 1-acyl-sn-glycerol-3-phosphate acyltransferase [Actinomycetota bacterium]